MDKEKLVVLLTSFAAGGLSGIIADIAQSSQKYDDPLKIAIDAAVAASAFASARLAVNYMIKRKEYYK